MILRLRVPIALFLLLVGVVSPAVAAPPAVPDVTGTWLGYFQSTLIRDAGSFYVAIREQDHRRFSGVFVFPHTLDMSPVLVIPLDGTLAATNRFNVVGKGDMGKFGANGDLYPLADGSGWAMFDYKLKAAAWSDNGLAWMIKSFRGGRAPVLDREWIGEFTSDDGTQKGPVSVTIREQKGSDFSGQATVGNMSFPFLGSVADKGKEGSSLHALGATPNIWFRIDGFLGMDEETIQATFTANFADGSVLRGSFMIRCNERGE